MGRKPKTMPTLMGGLPKRPKRVPGPKRPMPFAESNLHAKIFEPAVINESTWIQIDQLPGYLRRVTMLPCWPEVETRMLVDGYPIPWLARWIQEERCEGSWMSRPVLINYLRELRAAAPAFERFAARLPGYRERMRERYGDRLSELDVYLEHLDHQRERLEEMYAQESTTGVRDPGICREQAVLIKMLDGIFEMRTALGMISQTDHVSGEMSPELVNRIRNKYGDSTAETLLNPASQGRILAAYKLIKQAAGLEGLDLATDYKYEANNREDGKVIEMVPAAPDEKK